jgi:ketosteroid isomerase-like protein
VTVQRRIEAVQRADAAFFTALTNGDIPALETLLADPFLIVDVASGSVHRRAAFLEAIRGGRVTFNEIKTFPDEGVVRLVGAHVGIAVGRTAMSFSAAGGAVADVSSRYTHVFRASGRNWRLLSAQGTPITTSASP